MKTVFRVESANEENIRGGWYLLADSLAAAREVYPAHLFPSATFIEVGKGLCVECNEHPPAGEVGCLGDDELLRDKEIWEHKARIEWLQAILDDLLGEANELEEEIANEERELRALQPVSKSKLVEKE